VKGVRCTVSRNNKLTRTGWTET